MGVQRVVFMLGGLGPSGTVGPFYGVWGMRFGKGFRGTEQATRPFPLGDQAANLGMKMPKPKAKAKAGGKGLNVAEPATQPTLAARAFLPASPVLQEFAAAHLQ